MRICIDKRLIILPRTVALQLVGGFKTRKRSMTKLVVIVALITLLSPLISATGAHAQNVAQIDGTQGVQCPEHGVVGDVPGLSLSLETTGSPVLMIYTVQFNA